MNKLLLSIITAPLYISLHSICMTLNPLQKHQQLCQIILKNDNRNFKKLQTLIKRNSFEQEDLIQARNFFVGSIQQEKMNLLKKIEDSLERIKKTYNINAHIWNTFHTLVTEKDYQRIYNEQFPLSYTYHDQTIPQQIRNLFIKNLEVKNIHPRRINIFSKKNCSFPYLFYTTEKDSTNLYIDAEQFSKLSQSHQIAISSCAIEAMFQNAQILTSTLLSLESTFNTTNKSILVDKDYIELDRLCKNTLTICLPCIDNPDLTPHILKFHCDYYCPNLTLSDFQLLSKINKNLEGIRLIEKHINPSSEMEQVNL